MKTNDMITRYLDGLTSPEEERQLRATLEAKTTLTADERAVLDLFCLSFPEEDTAALLAEDVSQSTNHHSQFFFRRLVVVSGIAAAVILTFILWPEGNSPLTTFSQGEKSGHQQERAEAKTQPPTVEMTEGQAMMAVATQQPAPASTPPMTATTRPPQAPKHIAQAVIPATPVEAEEVVEECTPPAQDASLIRAAQTDLEYRNRLRTIEITTQAQAEQAFEAAVAAVLCSREPT